MIKLFCLASQLAFPSLLSGTAHSRAKDQNETVMIKRGNPHVSVLIPQPLKLNTFPIIEIL
jgi:hypothetical protein